MKNPKDIKKLIEKIAPFNNAYRAAIKEGKSGSEVLEIMWAVGEILREAGIKNIHPVAWQVYGRSRGLKRSNITRDFLSYCFRIRKYFKKKDEIEKEFPRLQRYSLFREALPLLENPKFRLVDSQMDQLKRVLNSSEAPARIKKYLVGLKSKRIGISNPRTQRLEELKPEARRFIRLYNLLKGAILKKDEKELDKVKKKLKPESSRELSRLLIPLTQEGLSYPELDPPKDIQEEWKELWQDLARLHERGKVEDRNRFRRLVPPGYLMNMAEMINALYDDLELERIRERFSQMD